MKGLSIIKVTAGPLVGLDSEDSLLEASEIFFFFVKCFETNFFTHKTFDFIEIGIIV